ncbi:NAD(P)-binding protein [Armillaria novae-zelandiae]|uniref:D-xylose 1-dehydrogenase (NADP(+), D-xylono-1,5-lactone-forming) n=1 Tax=Armillaria novae-zelandiae TaxID=153914 RepID=A0AA39NSG1_9AGAR|nr:NAD(P)-binding protein [Armillaria novae-zelandiae]
MSSFFSFLKRVYNAASPPVAAPLPDSKPIKFGIIGAAAIAPDAIINPAKSHPEAVVYAVAARDIHRAKAYAKKYGIEKVYGGPNGYQELLDDPEIEAIYNPLPNGLHYEWTMKALLAGKHVLLEKPSSNTAEETRKMFELAESKGLVLLEAFHYRFHPAIQRAKDILDSGELGKIKSISTTLMLHAGFMSADDIRFKYDLGGGAMMDVGTYTLNCIRYLASANPVSVLSASAEIHTPSSLIDRRTTATLELPNDIIGTLTCDLAVPWKFIPPLPSISAKVECEGGTLEVYNYVMPTWYHSITVTKRGGAKRVEKVYKYATKGAKGEDWWMTYRYQLEAFVDRLKGRTPQTWLDKEDAIANMEWIEKIYEKTGLGVRPKSEYVAP